MIENVIPFVHDFLKTIITKEDYTIDATCGNGYDTLFLAEHSKHVFAYDIQAEAINNTNELLSSKGYTNYTLINNSHDRFVECGIQEIKAITYNLGYLPNGNKAITTKKDSTINSLKSGIKILSEKGVIAIICYVGHPGGLEEAMEVEKFISTLSNKEFKVVKYQFLNVKTPPYVLLIEKQ